MCFPVSAPSDINFLLRSRFFLKVSELFEKTRVRPRRRHAALLLRLPRELTVCACVPQKIEARVAADEDLKLADLLKYYLRESQAAKVSAG